MNEYHTLSQRGGLPYPGGYAASAWPPTPAPRESGGVGLTLAVWIPTLAIGAALVASGQPLVGLMLLGAVVVLHSIIQPRIAIYALLATLPIDWLANFFPNITGIGKLVGVLALVISFPRLVSSVTSLKWDRCAPWMFVLIAWAAIACLWAVVPLHSLIVWQTVLLNWGLIVLICLHLNSRRALRTGVLVFTVSCLLAGLLIIQTNDPSRVTYRKGERAQAGTMVGEMGEADPNRPSRQLAVGALACLYFIITSRGAVRRVLLLLCILAMTVAILLLKGRAVYVALPSSLIATVLLLKGAGLGRRILLAVVLGVVCIIVGVAVVKLGFMGVGIKQRFASIFEEGTEAGGRAEIWLAHVDAFLSSGMRGVGLGSMHWHPGYGGKVAHNDCLHILAELGLVGFICFLGFHLTLFLRIRRLDRVWDKFFCLAVWFFTVLAAMTEIDWYYSHYTLAIALVLATVRLNESERRRMPQLVYAPPRRV